MTLKGGSCSCGRRRHVEETTQVQRVGWAGVKVGGGDCPHLGSCKRCQPGRERPQVGVKCFEASPMSDILNINTLTPLAAAITSSKTKLTKPGELSTVAIIENQMNV